MIGTTLYVSRVL